MNIIDERQVISYSISARRQARILELFVCSISPRGHKRFYGKLVFLSGLPIFVLTLNRSEGYLIEGPVLLIGSWNNLGSDFAEIFRWLPLASNPNLLQMDSLLQ